MARYAETLKNRVVAKLLPPESASVSAIAKEVGVTVQTLERWPKYSMICSMSRKGNCWARPKAGSTVSRTSGYTDFVMRLVQR